MIAGCEIDAFDWQLPAAHCPLSTTHSLLPTAHCYGFFIKSNAATVSIFTPVLMVGSGTGANNDE